MIVGRLVIFVINYINNIFIYCSSQSRLTVSTIIDYICNHNLSANLIYLNDVIKSLVSSMKEILGSEENITDEVLASILAFTICQLHNEKNVSVAKAKKLSSIYGNQLSQQRLYKFLEVVNKLSPYIENTTFVYLESIAESKEVKEPVWGEHIIVEEPEFNELDFNNLQDLNPYVAINTKNAEQFTMAYKSEEHKRQIPNNITGLLAFLIETKINMSVLANILKSSESNDHIQNDLFDFLGFEQFDLIQRILKQRITILKYCKTISKTEGHSGKPIPQPAIATQVVVQSEHERQLKKQTRRDERKLNRLLKSDKLQTEEEEEDIRPAQLRIAQQKNLLEQVSKQPILRKPGTSEVLRIGGEVRYPNVYDAQLEIKTNASFIGGQRILLPKNVQRYDCKEYEEVKIPACDVSSTLKVGENRIKIENLDDIGKMLFQNTKELNRIQSVVFPTAYHSNDNLLVCAPTGAGKLRSQFLIEIFFRKY